ncbi:MAG: ORF6C domain-containing protein [Anaerolineae bacterium]|nr:ORF6C domain-containing protein [Anaerolineae bacterium]
MSEKDLVPVEQKTVLFYDDEITAVRLRDGRIVVPLRPICESLGLAWSSQLQRVRRDPVLEDELVSVFVINTESQRGGREVQCLPLDMLHGFLFGVSANRVKPELHERVLRYQRECYRVLHEAFQEGRLTVDPDFDLLLQQASEDAVEAYQMALAMVKLAKNQIMLEARMDNFGRVLADHNNRLETIEATLSDPDRFITREQASRISQAVRAIGFEVSKQSGRNEFGAVYGELYRNFEISAYRELPASQYEQAMKWLNAWYQRLTNQNLPF